MMQQSGQYSPVPMVPVTRQQEDLTPGQKEVMASLFGKYYKQAGKAVMYLKTPNGQKVIGTTLLLTLLLIATKSTNKKG